MAFLEFKFGREQESLMVEYFRLTLSCCLAWAIRRQVHICTKTVANQWRVLGTLQSVGCMPVRQLRVAGPAHTVTSINKAKRRREFKDKIQD